MNSQKIDFGLILKKALSEYQEGNKKVAINDFDKLLSIELQDPLAFRNKGILLINLERFTEAISYFDEILKQNPNDREIICRKGIALEMLGRYEEALMQYDKTLSIEPQHPLAFRNKGILLINLERFTEAISYFDEILKQNPNDREVLFSKAIALELLGKNEESVPTYLDSLDIKLKDMNTMHDFIFYFINGLRLWDPMDFYEKMSEKISNEPFTEFFKQCIESEREIEKLYKKYLNRIPELNEIKNLQRKIFKEKTMDFLEEEIMKYPEASNYVNGKKYEAKIKELYKKYLDRLDVKQEELNHWTLQILYGKSLEWIEEQFKNSEEAKQLKYWHNDE